MNEKSRFLILIPIVFLLLALTRMPYSYYGTMRVVVSLATLVFMIIEFNTGLKHKEWGRVGLWCLILVGIMLLFNPVMPFKFPRQTWLMLNIGAVVLLFFYFFFCASRLEGRTKDEAKPASCSDAAQPSWVFNKGQDLSRLVKTSPDRKAEIRIVTTLKDHCDLLSEALNKAKKRVVIASPYLSKNAIAVGHIEQRILSAVARGVRVKVICNPDLGDKSANQVLAFDQCISSLIRSGAEVNDRKIHSKFIIMDSDWLAIGSFNWLSSARDPNSQNAMQETSVYYSGEDAARMISELLGEYKV